MFCNITHAFSIGAIGNDKQFIIFSNNACQYSLHAKGSASLHENCRIIFFRDMCKL